MRVATRLNADGQQAAEALREERVDLLDVVDEAAHQVAGLDRLEVADVERDDLGEDLSAQRVERLSGPTSPSRRICMRCANQPTERGADQQQRRHGQHRPAGPASCARYRDVDEAPGERRRRRARDRGGEQPQTRPAVSVRSMGQQVAEQRAAQPRGCRQAGPPWRVSAGRLRLDRPLALTPDLGTGRAGSWRSQSRACSGRGRRCPRRRRAGSRRSRRRGSCARAAPRACRSAIRPASITTTRSARRAVDRRWATMKVVRPSMSRSS